MQGWLIILRSACLLRAPGRSTTGAAAAGSPTDSQLTGQDAPRSSPLPAAAAPCQSHLHSRSHMRAQHRAPVPEFVRRGSTPTLRWPRHLLVTTWRHVIFLKTLSTVSGCRSKLTHSDRAQLDAACRAVSRVAASGTWCRNGRRSVFGGRTRARSERPSWSPASALPPGDPAAAALP